jgi:UDP-N-acetylmuramate dehydrogenase
VNSLIVEDNVPLAPMTTFGIGGAARHFIRACSENTVMQAVRIANEKGLPLFILGGGSNLLVADEGYSGVVLRIELTGVDWTIQDDHAIVHAGAGEDWDKLVAACVERNLAGVECLSGIPGSVGGTPVQNVGAYGQEVSQVLTSVRAIDRVSETFVDIPHSACEFSYRSSVFNTTARDRFIVLGVTCRLAKNGKPTVHYSDVRRALEGRTETPSLADVRQVVREIRAGKAMLLTVGDPDCRSAGSFFKNPIVAEGMFADIQRAAGAAVVPRYPARDGYVKTAAAWLIEQSGFQKGYTTGRAGLSRKHTLALVNKGGATARDVLELAREIRQRVEHRVGVRLIPEPVFLGFQAEIYDEFFGPPS